MENEITEKQYDETLIIRSYLLEKLAEANSIIKKYETQFGDLVKFADAPNLYDALKNKENFKESKETLMGSEEKSPSDFIAALKNGNKKELITGIIDQISKNDVPFGDDVDDLDSLFEV